MSLLDGDARTRTDRPARVRSRSARWLAIVAVVAAAGLAVAAAWLGPGRDTGGAILGAAGDPAVLDTAAPDFELSVLGAPGSLGLSDFRGHVTVVNLWASWCTPCRNEAPGLQATWRDYRADGVRFLGIDELDDDAAASAFVREFGLTYPSVTDPAGALSDDFALIGLPETFVVDAAGTIRYRFTGYVDDGVLRSVLDGMVAS